LNILFKTITITIAITIAITITFAITITNTSKKKMKYYKRDNTVVIKPFESSEITDSNEKIIDDFTKKEELIELIKICKNIEYFIQESLDWLPLEDINYIQVEQNLFDIDVKHGEIIINSEKREDMNYDKLKTDARLAWAFSKFNKVIYYCNHPIDWLPNNILVLVIKNNLFNYPLENLPLSLESLTISAENVIFNLNICKFNHPLNMLPVGLKRLCINGLTSFNHSLDDLPPTLEFLEIFEMFLSDENYLLIKEIPNLLYFPSMIGEIAKIKLYRTKLPKKYLTYR